MPRLLHANDVLEATFTQTQFREGYDEREVDEFLDDVVATLRRHEGSGPAGAFRIRSEGLESVRFSVTKLRRGYDQGEIDAFLADVLHTLRHHESGGAPPPHAVPTGTEAPASSSTSAVVEPESWGARLLRALRGERG